MSRQPFAATPNPRCCAAVKTMKTAYQSLQECLISQQGIGILTAFSGLGKSLLCQTLALSLSSTRKTIYLANSHFDSPRDLLQTVVSELGLPYKNMTDQELRLDITRNLTEILNQNQNGTIIFIDEAENLSDELLEEIRTLSNLNIHGRPLVQLVLSGQIQLEEKLMSPELTGLQQRIGCHVTLEPFNRQETIDYIQFRIDWAGGNIDQVFTQSALEFISQVCDGNSRCINALCEHSLARGAELDEKPIDITAVMKAFDQLKQLPLRWNDPDNLTNKIDKQLNHLEEFTSDFLETEEFPEDSDSVLVDDSVVFEFGGDELSDEDEEIALKEDDSDISVFEFGSETEDIETGNEIMEEQIPDDACSHKPAHHDELQGETETRNLNSGSDIAQPGNKLMNEKNCSEVDYCVPAGDGWKKFNPENSIEPIKVIEQLESAIQDIMAEEKVETLPVKKNPVINGFEEEIVDDPYAKIDSKVINARQVKAEVTPSPAADKIEEETIPFKEVEKAVQSKSKGQQENTRIDSAELRQAIRNEDFDVILPDDTESDGKGSIGLSEPKFMARNKSVKNSDFDLQR